MNGTLVVQDTGLLKIGHNSASCLVIGALVLGFCHGLKLANWQVPLEGAQVLAGLVDYPTSSPQGIYHKKLWTLLNQIPALALHLGVPERLLSVVISGLGGAAFYLGISLTTYAICKNLIVSLAMPLVVLGTAVAGGAGGITYPVILINSPHTYGSFGLSIVLIAVGLIGCGRIKTAVLIMGLTPSIHPSWGAWLNLIVILSALVYFRHLRNIVRDFLPWLLVGYAITGLSLLLWVVQSSGITAQVTEYTYRNFSTFAKEWDSHRRNIQFSDINFRTGWTFHLVVLLTISCGAWLALFRNNRYSSKKLLLTVLLVSSMGAMAASGIVSIFPGTITDSFRVLMPQRWLNLSILCFLPVLIGALSWRRYSDVGWSMLLMIAVVVFFRYEFGRDIPIPILWFITCLMIIFGLLGSLSTNKAKSTTRIEVLGFVLLLVPVLSATPLFLYMFSSSGTYFISGIVVAAGTIVSTLLMVYVTDNLKRSSKLLGYSSICLLIFGINLMIVPLLMPEWSSGSITTDVMTGVLLVILSLGIAGARKRMLVEGNRFLRYLNQYVYQKAVNHKNALSLVSGNKHKEIHFAIVLVLLGCGYFLIKALNDPIWGRTEFQDRTSSAFWKEVERGDGLLLTGSDLYLIQLRSRRPVLIDGGGLNWLPYIPEAGVEVESILSNVYGVEYFESAAHMRGRLEHDSGRELWIQRNIAEWKNLKERFGVTNVIVYDDWTLDLPLMSKGHGYALYSIP